MAWPHTLKTETADMNSHLAKRYRAIGAKLSAATASHGVGSREYHKLFLEHSRIGAQISKEMARDNRELMAEFSASGYFGRRQQRGLYTA